NAIQCRLRSPIFGALTRLKCEVICCVWYYHNVARIKKYGLVAIVQPRGFGYVLCRLIIEDWYKKLY
ncbi:MAG: hypothetical protein KGZ39_03515, partial [Simkania sp.]|nr:hypothetical protein [Simkania sp.]